mgnify:CR=1 FL=1
MSKGIVYEEGKHLIVLFAGESVNDISQKLYDVCQNNSDVYVGIGTTVSQLTDIHRSYDTAFTAYQLTKTALPKNFLEYDKLGVYKLLADIHNQSLTTDFLNSTLGPILDYALCIIPIICISWKSTLIMTVVSAIPQMHFIVIRIRCRIN